MRIEGFGAVHGAVFGLMGLVMAFTFSGASLALYVIIDMEYPRVGLIRVTAMDRVLQDVRDSMR